MDGDCLLEPRLSEVARPPLLTDGGLATYLESLGYPLRTELWSGQALLDGDRGKKIAVAAHKGFAKAGADILATLTYQCSATGLRKSGLSDAESASLYRRSVDWCREAFGDESEGLVAVSIGPYGASLCDGSEYRGGYRLSAQRLHAFHAPAMRWAADSGADLVAIETIPDVVEVEALIKLSGDLRLPAWLSFSVGDDRHLADGTRLSEVAARCADAQFWAVGINCCPADRATAAASVFARANLPLVIYPNSGERYVDGSWDGTSQALPPLVSRWIDMGAVAVGGCCRTTPNEVAEMRRAIDSRFGS